MFVFQYSLSEEYNLLAQAHDAAESPYYIGQNRGATLNVTLEAPL